MAILPEELWGACILPQLDLIAWCVLRETSRAFVPRVNVHLYPWGMVAGAAHPLRGRYRIDYKGTRSHVREHIRALVQAGALGVLQWLSDRGWPMAFLVFSPVDDRIYAQHEAVFFAWVYDQHAASDWQRRYFVAAIRDLFWAHVFHAKMNYSFYGLSVRHPMPPVEDKTRLQYFSRIDVTASPMAWNQAHSVRDFFIAHRDSLL
jgi:hypothetical protein